MSLSSGCFLFRSGLDSRAGLQLAAWFRCSLRFNCSRHVRDSRVSFVVASWTVRSSVSFGGINSYPGYDDDGWSDGLVVEGSGDGRDLDVLWP